MASTALSKLYSLHGFLPVFISIKQHPKDQISAFLPYLDCFMTSGAIQGMLPVRAAQNQSERHQERVFSISKAQPKSQSFICEWESRIFEHLRSLWIIWLECRKFKPSRTCFDIFFICASSREPNWSKFCARLPWLMYSMQMYNSSFNFSWLM